ncbi:MAG: hypothetical protein BM564_01575 [Bacteroidetes bacterium MedPE-SWsnd-G2]|nr:MAG: hypothetical protein BM564_01575 [Bacteroidetes bacterium MedPE-SWsnd-G2]
MPYTGGLLNELNGKMGISAPHRSVPVMKLIKYHKPKSKSELEHLIKWHSKHDCHCKVSSKGSIVDFGLNLYHSQLPYWGEIKFSITECIQWEYDLFVTQSLKGGILERQAIENLSHLLPHYKFSEAIGYLDEDLRVDLLVSKPNNPDETVIAGIQVKPQSYNFMRPEVKSFNKTAHKKWNKPVFFLFYNDKQQWVNLDSTCNSILQIPL